MGILVKLKFGDGDFQQGFSQNINTIAITNPEGKSTEIKIQLPSAPEIPVLYQKWVHRYGILTNPLRIGFKRKQVTNFSWSESYRECEQFAQDLLTQLNDWLVDIKPQLEGVIQLNPDSEIIFIIDAKDIKCQYTKDILHRLPWREWDYFSGDYCLETALNFNESQSKVNSIKDEKIFRRVKITSIFGDNQNIDIKTDRELIEKLEKRGAELTFLSQPKRPDLIKLWDEPCDILFYSGHSQTDKINQVGYLQINQEDSLNPEEVKNTFREAIVKGLKLAIFNSCDGLGLAQQFANLGLPYIIVWREAVPDKIAQDFLKYFLASFSTGKSLFASVRDARVKLEELTDKEDTQKQPAGVNWLPVICKNTLDAPPKWEDLGGLTGKLPDSPYKGLSAFQEEDAEYFFGREQFIADLFEAVNTKPLVPVVGASGSGKSSVVFAGLVPRLRATGKVQIVSFRPGNNPFDALAVALSTHHQLGDLGSRLKELELEINLQHDEKQLCKIIESFVNSNGSSSQRSVLIADQFEELYTLTTEEQRQPFLDALLYAVRFAPAFTLVVTLRADFYGHTFSYRPLSDALQAGTYNLAQMNPIELRAAIEKPAHKMKVELEQGLTTKLIDDLGKKPGRLPLLEFTLSLLWQKPNKWYLTHQAYGEIGGLEKALAKYADSVLNPLSAAEKEQAERIFIQLVRPGEGTEDTKRVATRAEVGEKNWNLVKSLADNRLVVTGWDEVNQIETVEIIHEALIREWGTLREWIRRNREFRIWQERLKPDVREWENKKYDPEILLQGTRLAIAQDWLKQRQSELTLLEQNFINASVKRRDKEQRKHKRRRQLTISGLIGGLMLVSTFAGISEIGRTDAEAGKISSAAENFFSEDDHEVALTEAIKAGKLINQTIWKPWIAPETKMQAISRLRQIVYGYQIKTFKGHSRAIHSIIFSPDGRTIAAASDLPQVIVWDTFTGQQISYNTWSRSGGSQSFSGDFVNKRSLSSEGRITADSTSISFSPNGRIIAHGTFDGKVRLREVTTEFEDTATTRQISTSNLQLETFKEYSDPVTSISFSPDSKIIAHGSLNGTVKLRDISTGRLIKTFKEYSDPITNISFSPDGRIIAYGSERGGVRLQNIATGHLIKILRSYSGVSFSPDSRTIAFISGYPNTRLSDNKITLWDIVTGKEIKTLTKSSGIYSGSADRFRIMKLSFSPDGKRIVSASRDGTLTLWDTSTGKEIKTVIKDFGVISSLKFSPDGKKIASASTDGRLTLWDTTTGQQIKTLKSDSRSVNSISFSPVRVATPQGFAKIIASASSSIKADSTSINREIKLRDSTNGEIKLWDSTTGKEIKALKEPPNWITDFNFSRDGKTIVFGFRNGMVQLLDTKTKFRGTKILKKRSGEIRNIRFSPDGKIIASALSNGTVELQDSTTGKEIKTLKGHSQAVNSISFSPDGRTITSASSDKTVKLWDITTGKEIKTLKGHSQAVNSISFSPDGKTIASGSKDKTVKLWDVSNGRNIKTLNKAHSAPINSISFSPDNKTIVSASDDGTVKLWEFNTGKEIKIFKENSQSVSNVRFSPDGKIIAYISGDTKVKLWDATTGEEIKTLVSSGSHAFKGDSEKIYSFSFSPDSKTIISLSRDGQMSSWAIDNKLNGNNIIDKYYATINSTLNFSIVSFSPDGKKIASASSDGVIKLWDRLTGREIKTLEGHTQRVKSVSFSPDGKIIVSASDDQTVKIWDATTGKEIKTLKINSASFSPDGKTIASISRDRTVKLWDFVTGKEIKTLKGHSRWVNSVSFSPDGQTIASASNDTTVKLWNISTGKEIKTLQGHSERVSSVSFSPDGKTIASASADGTVKLWDIATGREITTLKGHSSPINSVSFSPDGKTIASASSDGMVILWNFDLESLLGEGCDLIGDYLQNNSDVSEDDKRLCHGIATNDK